MAFVSSTEPLSQNAPPFDVFNARKALKDTPKQPNDQFIEDYLVSLDPYRFSTAPSPLPLPFKVLKRAGDAEVGRLLEELLQFDNNMRSKEDIYLPPPVPGVQSPRFVVELRYKSEIYGPPRDTLSILLRSNDEGEDTLWPVMAQTVQMRLKRMEVIPFMPKMPYNVGTYDVEVLDVDRAFNPFRERLDGPDPDRIITAVDEAYFEVYNASKHALRYALADILGGNFIDLSLELQRDQTGHYNQIAVVVHVLPETKSNWYDLRMQVMSCLRDPMIASMNTQSLMIEVEIIPDYNAASLRRAWEAKLESLREHIPYTVDDFCMGINDNPANAVSTKDTRISRRKAEGPDSAYATGPQPSPATPGFRNKPDESDSAQSSTSPGVRDRETQTYDDNGQFSDPDPSSSRALTALDDMVEIPQVPNHIDHSRDLMILPRKAYQPTLQRSRLHNGIKDGVLSTTAATPSTNGISSTIRQNHPATNDLVGNWINSFPTGGPALNSDLHRESFDTNPFSDDQLVVDVPYAAVEASNPFHDVGPARTDTSDDCYLSHPDEPPRSTSRRTTRSGLDPFENSVSESAVAPIPNIVSPTPLVTPHENASQPDLTSNGTVVLPRNVFLPHELAASSGTRGHLGYATSNSAALQNESSQWNVYPVPLGVARQDKSRPLGSTDNSFQNDKPLRKGHKCVPLTAPRSGLEAGNSRLASNVMTENMMFDFAPPADIHLDGPSSQYHEPTRMDSRTPLKMLTPDRPPGRLDWMKNMKHIPRKLRGSISKLHLRDSSGGDST
ncbi:MAG: hypothetical protein Q9164_004967 [Protoblastenia rupestris]